MTALSVLPGETRHQHHSKGTGPRPIHATNALSSRDLIVRWDPRGEATAWNEDRREQKRAVRRRAELEHAVWGSAAHERGGGGATAGCGEGGTRDAGQVTIQKEPPGHPV